MTWILWLGDATLADLGRVGGKGANLGHLLRAGFPVPDGFCITTDAYDAVVAASGAGPVIEQALAGLTAGSDIARFEEAAARITAQFRILPDDLWAAIRAAHRELKGRVAVRSSATAEDLPGASFAGQQETFLGVAGEADLRAAILRCFASLWSVPAILYRQRMNFPHQAVKLSVVVQEMVEARVAGVLFTAHPITGDRGVCVIEAAPGLGEAVVSGTAAVDQYVTDKAAGVLQSAAPVNPAGPVLTPAEVAALSGYGKEIESLYGAPQDIEWAYDNDQLWILQARPITTLGADAPPAPRVKLERPRPTFNWLTRQSLGPLAERFGEPLRPFDMDVCFRAIIAGAARTAGHFGLRLVAWPERLFWFQNGVAVALYPTGRPQLSLQLLLPGIPRGLKMLWSTDPAEWQEAEYPHLARRAAELQGVAARAAGLSDEGLLDLIEQGAAFASDAFYSRRNYIGLFLLPHWLKKRLGWLFPGEGDVLHAELMAGIDHMTSRMNRALGRLAEAAAADPAVRAALEAPADPAVRLQGTPFLERAEEFLVEFGSRETVFVGPSWGEAPEILWATLRSLVRGRPAPPQPGRYDAALKSTLERLPGWTRRGFRRLVERARAAEATRENSHFMILHALPIIRAGARELGIRFVVRGLLEHPDEVFFVQRSEIEAAVSGESADLRERAARRRAIYEAAKAEGLLPSSWFAPHRPGRILKGTPASPGVVEGLARVILQPGEFHRLQPGEILVCRSTNPAWTPLFLIAAAVVAESGGAMAHAAIVAREYGIPAVLGARGALDQIREGQRIRVDGRTGEVHIV